MTKVSRMPVRKEELDSYIDELWYTMGFLNQVQIRIFFREFLSPTEIIMFAKRLEILKGLRKDMQYQILRDALKVSEPTVAKMSMVLKKCDPRFPGLLDLLMQEEEARWKEYIEKYGPKISKATALYRDRG